MTVVLNIFFSSSKTAGGNDADEDLINLRESSSASFGLYVFYIDFFGPKKITCIGGHYIGRFFLQPVYFRV